MTEKFNCEYCNKEFDSKENLNDHKREEHNDKVCYFCGEEFKDMPFKCKYCGKKFCAKHRLPENHNCTYEKGEEQEEKWFEEKEGKETKKEEAPIKTNRVMKKIKEFGWVKAAILVIIILTILRVILKLT